MVLANPGHKLKPSMFAQLQIARPVASRIMLPQTAVLHNGNVTEVYVPDGQGKYAIRQVATGATRGDQIEIVSGLHDGEKVVTQGAAFLREPAGD